MRTHLNTRLGAALLLAAAGLCYGARPRMAPELGGVDETAAVNVIVEYRQTPTEDHHRRLQNLGGTVVAHLHSISADAVRLPARSLAALASDSEVAYIAPDRPVRGLLDLTAAAVNAAAAQNYGLDGTGIGVAVIDSGITGHPDLGKRVVYSVSMIGGLATDPFGHGTHVAGIIGSDGKDSSGRFYTRTFRGIAPNVNLIDIRVLDATGVGTDSSVVAGIEKAISLKSKYNIRVINLSLGRPVFESYTLDPLCRAVEAAWKAGIVVVAAAGNDGRDNSLGTDGYGTISSPGNDPYVITVGAMKTNATPGRGDDTIASYSSKGPTAVDHIVKPDIVAPGNHVVSLLGSVSALYKNFPGNTVPFSYYTAMNIGFPTPEYFVLSGTSMATPVVSGAAALLLQQHPTLTPDQVKARLMKTAYKSFPASSTVVDPVTGISYTSYYDIFTVGAGYLDIAAALSNTDVASGSAMSPTVQQVGTSGNYALTYGSSAAWSLTNAASFNLAVVWGSNVLTVNGQSNAVIWGTSTSVPALAVIWGQNVVWGASTSNGAENNGILVMGE